MLLVVPAEAGTQYSAAWQSGVLPCTPDPPGVLDPGSRAERAAGMTIERLWAHDPGGGIWNSSANCSLVSGFSRNFMSMPSAMTWSRSDSLSGESASFGLY